MTIRGISTTLLLVACAASAPGCCTGLLWSQTLRAEVEGPEAVGAIPSRFPDEPDRLFISYSDIRAPREVAYVVADLRAADDGAGTTITPNDVRRISVAQLERARVDPRWRDLESRRPGRTAASADSDGKDVRTVSLWRVARRPRGAATSRSLDVWRAEPPEDRARWRGRLVRLPQSVPRPTGARLTGAVVATLLTPAAVAADVVLTPLYILYVLTGPTC
jgi:hypothetical protein